MRARFCVALVWVVTLITPALPIEEKKPLVVATVTNDLPDGYQRGSVQFAEPWAPQEQKAPQTQWPEPPRSKPRAQVPLPHITVDGRNPHRPAQRQRVASREMPHEQRVLCDTQRPDGYPGAPCTNSFGVLGGGAGNPIDMGILNQIDWKDFGIQLAIFGSGIAGGPIASTAVCLVLRTAQGIEKDRRGAWFDGEKLIIQTWRCSPFWPVLAFIEAKTPGQFVVAIVGGVAGFGGIQWPYMPLVNTGTQVTVKYIETRQRSR